MGSLRNRIENTADFITFAGKKRMNRTLRTKKRISAGQLVGLLLLLFFSYQEVFPLSEADSFFFPAIFLFCLFCILHSRRILPLAWHEALVSRLHPLCVRLRAFHIWQIRGGRTPALNPMPCTCRNCGDTFTGNFCPRCGQSRYTPRYVLKGIAGNVLRTIFRVDGKFAHTLLELLYRPGHMMRDFIRGRRVHYTLPLAMVFLMTAFYMLTAQLIVPEVRERRENRAEEQADTNFRQSESLQQALVELRQEKSRTSDAVARQTIEYTIRHLEKELADVRHQDSITGRKLSGTASGHGSFAFFRQIGTAVESVPFLANVWNLMCRWGHGNKAFHILLTLPLLAVATRWAFYRRRKPADFNLMEHILIQAYIAAQILLVSILVVPFNGTAHVDDLYEVPLWFIFLLFCWDYRQLYLCTWWRSFWKTVLMFVYCLLLVVALAVAGVLLYGVINGTTDLSL